MSDAPLHQLPELAEAKASGELVCEAAGSEVHVFLQAGRIAWASDSRHPQAFLQHLREHARIDDLEQVLAECRRTRAPIVETLVAWKLATPQQVKAALRHQIGLAVAELEQHAASARAVFFGRPQYANSSDEYSFAVEEVFPAAKREAPAAKLAPPPEPRERSRRAVAAAEPAAAAAAEAVPARQEPRRMRWLVPAIAIALALAAVAAVGLSRRAGRGKEASSLSSEEKTGPAGGLPELAFGMAAPLSGATKELGRAMRAGIETSFAVANEAGGVNGRKLRLVAVDDQYDPSRTLSLVQKLVEERKVLGIVGMGAASAAVALPYMMEQKLVFFGALSGTPLSRKESAARYAFSYRPGEAEETAAAMRYLVEVRRIPPSKIAVFYQDDDFGRAGFAGVRDQMQALRQDPAGLIRATYARNTADVVSAVATIRNEKSLRAVIMVATHQAAVQFIQGLKDAGSRLVFTNVSMVDADQLSEALVSAGKGYASDVLVTQVVPLPTSRSTAALEYQSALAKHAADEKPGFVSFEGYIVGKILVNALRQAGKDPTPDSLVSALEEQRGLDLGIGTKIQFAPGDHRGSRKVWGTMLQPDGSYSAVKLE